MLFFALDTYSVIGRFAVDRTGIQVKRLDMLIQWQAGQKQIVWPEEIRTRPAILWPRNSMNCFRLSLQYIIIWPAVALVLIAGLILYFLILGTVSDYAKENIRSTLSALLRSAVTIADSEVDRQNRESQVSNADEELSFQLNTRIRLEDFARDQNVGIVILADGFVDFFTGISEPEAKSLAKATVSVDGNQLTSDDGSSYYVANARFTPWNWHIILAKDAADFHGLVNQVRKVYIGSAAALALTLVLLVLALRQFLVRPIYKIADEFGAGIAPTLSWTIAEFEHLSVRIADMMRSLSAKTKELETILQSMSDAIAVFDADMRLSIWNKQYATLYRYPDDLLRRGTRFSDIMRYNIDRGDYGNVSPDEQIEEILERARSLSPPRFEIDHADGTSVEVRRAPMPDGGFVTTYTDITLQRQSARLETANEAKSRFLENMSHDLRKPIAAVIEDCHLLLTQPGEAMVTSTRNILENASSNAKHLLGMVDDLLDMARIEADQVKVIARSLSLNALVSQALRVIGPAAQAKGLHFDWVAESEQEIHSDPRLLSRILVNLLSNAVEYTEEGVVSVRATRIGDHYEIQILKDTGVGISHDKLELIFDKFQRVEPTSGLTKPGMGIGLGLAISREFARLLGGDVGVEEQTW